MDEFCGEVAVAVRSVLGDGITLRELRTAAEAATGRRALVVPQVALKGRRMDEERLAAVVERALRCWIGQTHHEACLARLRGAHPLELRQRDAEYEDALEAYRQIVGIEPLAE